MLYILFHSVSIMNTPAGARHHDVSKSGHTRAMITIAAPATKLHPLQLQSTVHQQWSSKSEHLYKNAQVSPFTDDYLTIKKVTSYS